MSFTHITLSLHHYSHKATLKSTHNLACVYRPFTTLRTEMKKNILCLLVAVLAIASCKTREKVAYIQDIQPNEEVTTQSVRALKLVPGDKIGIVVTSATTPELAMRYNINPGSNTSSTQNADNLRYTIDENGNVDLPGIGRIEIGGLTRSEAAARIQAKYREGVINDAVITLAAYNQFVTILGDVARPGQQEITRDNLTILEAIGRAGDLNITGRRDCVKVIRQEGSVSKTYYVDLRSKDLFNSPVYNLQQNDIVYVEPNKVKMGQSTNNDNSVRSIATWLSVASVVTSITILITNAIK